MLLKSQRLNLKKDFKWTASGNHNQTKSFKLFYRLGENIQPKVGISLNKQYFKKANQRNLARRRASSAIQFLYPNLKQDVNLIIMPKDPVLEESIENLIEELKNVPDIYHTN